MQILAIVQSTLGPVRLLRQSGLDAPEAIKTEEGVDFLVPAAIADEVKRASEAVAKQFAESALFAFAEGFEADIQAAFLTGDIDTEADEFLRSL